MIEYLPWSLRELDNILELYSENRYSVLDVELGGACNMSCIYCDTPIRKAKALLDIKLIENLVINGGINWVFICGLGEPTVKTNYPKLIELLSICKKHNVKCSMFTNLVYLTDEIESYIEDGVLYILFKLDSFDKEKISKLFNFKQIDVYLKNIDIAKSLVNVENSYTNIAASIVPTTVNQNDLEEIIQYCADNNIFPMIGALENAGMSDSTYNKLALSEEALSRFKARVCRLTGVEYIVPICPAVIGGIHISQSNELIVDYYTGLSCHWFWLEPPKTKTLMKVGGSTKLDEIIEAIEDYRTQRLWYVKENYSSFKKQIFGGCGGDLSYMLGKYLHVMESKKAVAVGTP